MDYHLRLVVIDTFLQVGKGTTRECNLRVDEILQSRCPVAKAKLMELAETAPGDYSIFDQSTGDRLFY